MREIIQLKKIIPILFSFLLVLTGCENIEFNHSFREQLDEDLSVTYTFYETYDNTGNFTKLKFFTGKTIYPSEFPVYTHDDELLVGWQYLGNQIPKNISLDKKEYISSIKVGLKEESFFGIWKPKRYVTFVTNNDLTVATAVVAEGDCVASPQIEQKHGRFRCEGWYIDEELTELYDFKTPVMEDITLYAKWIEFNTIRYYKNDGSSDCHIEEVDMNQSYWVNDYMFSLRKNYGFVGWATTATGSAEIYPDKHYNELKTDLNLYAVWSTDLITITYIDKSSKFANAFVKVAKGAHVRIGQVFSDDQTWLEFLDYKWKVTGKEIKGFSTLTNEDIENLPYDTWGGHSVPEYDDDGNPVLDEYNNQRYTWSQWTEMTADTTFYVYWADRDYNVYFRYYDENGNNCWFDSQVVLWNEKAVRPDSVPHLAGHRFVDWYKEKWDGEQQKWVLEDTPFDFDTVINEDTMQNEWGIDLYAKFEPADTGELSATVTFTENQESDISVGGPYTTVSVNTVQFTADPGYTWYKWYFNGVCISDTNYNQNGVVLNSADYTGATVEFDYTNWPVGWYDIALIVFDGTNYYSWSGQLYRGY